MPRQFKPTLARTVALDAKASAFYDSNIDGNERLEELYRALEWRLAREPEAGHHIVGIEPPTYVIHTEGWVGSDELVAVYRFTADTVDVQSLRTVAQHNE